MTNTNADIEKKRTKIKLTLNMALYQYKMHRLLVMFLK